MIPELSPSFAKTVGELILLVVDELILLVVDGLRLRGAIRCLAQPPDPLAIQIQEPKAVETNMASFMPFRVILVIE